MTTASTIHLFSSSKSVSNPSPTRGVLVEMNDKNRNDDEIVTRRQLRNAGGEARHGGWYQIQMLSSDTFAVVEMFVKHNALTLSSVIVVVVDDFLQVS